MKRTSLLLITLSLMLTLLAIGASAAETVIYKNDFSDPATLSDFKQYRAEWEIKGGGLFVTDRLDPEAQDNTPEGAFSHIIYQADEKLTDYIVEVDYMNLQTSGGILFNVEQDSVSSTTNNAFYGYQAFIGNAANVGALGSSDNVGGWKGNIHVGTAGSNCTMGSNVHIKVTVKGDNIHVNIVNIDSGNEVYDYEYTIGSTPDKDALWGAGTVGLRMRYQYAPNLAVSAGNAYFDNFVITKLTDGEEPAASTEIKMTIGDMNGYVNGVAKALDAAPIIRQNRTMLPVRFVAENLGATVAWDGATSTATLTCGDIEIKITIGATTATINGEEKPLDAPAFIENSRTYLPVRFVAEALGGTVAWDGNTSTATITK